MQPPKLRAFVFGLYALDSRRDRGGDLRRVQECRKRAARCVTAIYSAVLACRKESRSRSWGIAPREQGSPRPSTVLSNLQKKNVRVWPDLALAAVRH